MDLGHPGHYYVVAAIGSEFFFFDGERWVHWQTGTFPSLATSALDKKTLTIAVNANLAAYHGTQIFAGYGFSDQDLLTRSNYALVHTLGPRYDLGVCYHAYGADFLRTAFVTIYHQPQVRDTVRQQLQGMADAGATVISTRLWFVRDPSESDFGETFRATFPISPQEIANLRQYVTDVATIVGTNGQRLRLDLSMLYLGWADYTTGSPETGLGFYRNMSSSEFTRRWEACLDGILSAATGVNRPDGVPVVDSVYFDGEVMIGAKQNQDWFLQTHYPTFVSRTRNAGFNPTLYFNINEPAANVLDTAWRDALYADLTGYRPLFWVYRSLLFMKQQGLPLPDRIDFSLYITDLGSISVDSALFSSLVQRVLKGCEAALTPLGAPRAYGIAETFYFADASRRQAYGRALAAEGRRNDQLQLMTFWTTPDSGGAGVHASYPFSIADYLPGA